MKRCFVFVFFLLAFIMPGLFGLQSVNAQYVVKVKIDNLWYKLNPLGAVATVSSSADDESYSGEIVIPETVDYDYYADGSPVQTFTVKEIEAYAFADCDGLTVHLPKTINRIIPSAFRGCTDLTIDAADVVSWCSILFYAPESQSHIPQPPSAKDTLFKYVDRFLIDGEEVVDLKIPDGATFVSQDAFNSYSGLQSVECAQSVKNIMPGAFFGCKNLKTVTIAGDGMETIWDDAFTGCSSLTSIVLPSTVKEIRKSSFQGCTSLSSFSWPENLTLIGDSAFKECSSLKNADLTSLSKIGDYAFYGCTTLDVALPDSCDYIGKYAFYGNTVLKTLDVYTEEVIGAHAFANCTGITQVSIGWKYEYNSNANEGIFEGCTNLKSAVLKPGQNIVSFAAFKDCTALTDVDIPEGLELICRFAFQGCTALTSIDLPDGVLRIYDAAFDGCSSLEEITIPSSVVELYNICSNCENLKSVHISGLDSWLGMIRNEFSLKGGRKLLVNGTLVTELERPKGGFNAIFRDYEYLEKLTIPIGSGDIMNDDFSGCDNISEIYCYAETPPRLSDYAFSDACIQLATVYVPGHLVEVYQQDAPTPYYPTSRGGNWSWFRIEPIPGTNQKCATPTIVYENGKLSFECDTEGAKFISMITSDDMGMREGSEINLTATYHISVYATMENYVKSDVVKATLCWIDAAPDIVVIDDVAEVEAQPVIIEHVNGLVTVKGVGDGQPVRVYSLAGHQVGAAVSQGSVATVSVGNQKGGVLLVKIGNKTIKVQ